MPTTIVRSDNFNTGVLYSLVAGDTLIVADSAFVGSSTAQTIYMAGNAVLRVDGTVYQNEGGLAVWGGIAGDYTVSILAGGAVMATATPDRAAMQFDAVATIYNAGLVQSMRGIGIIADGGSAITNTGNIFSADTGIILARSGGSDGSLINDGLIRAGQVTTSMAGHGVQIRADNVSVWNGGVIHTDKSGAAAIMVGALSAGSVFGAIIENHGTITARAGYGIDAFANGGLAVTVLNTGTITGGLYGIKGSRGEDDITNTGTIASLSRLFTSVFLDKGFDVFNNSGYITGDIYMGQDADIYNGAGALNGVHVFGETGNDLLKGGVQDDTIEGGDDHDTLFGAAGDDTLLGENGIDSLSGGAGDDNLTGGIGADVLTGGDGDDTQSGDAGRDTLYGLAGDDMLLGGGENDTYHINSQNDVIVELSGGGGMDEVIATAISIDLNHYDNVENARLAGARVLNLTGSEDRNILTGNMAANRMVGLGGADTLVGAGGNDTLTGGAGKDYLEGGIGADRFIFASAADIGNSATTRDFIADFASGEDKIQLTFMSSYVGDARFTAAGQVRYDQTTGLLYGNTDADLAAEWALTIGFRAPAAGDFVF